jgi:hypothetical protein
LWSFRTKNGIEKLKSPTPQTMIQQCQIILSLSK